MIARAIVILAVILTLAPVAAPARESVGSARTTLLRNREYAQALLDGIATARRSIFLTVYLFKINDSRGNLPREVAEGLLNARRRGVEVTVLLESSHDRSDQLNAENRRTAVLLRRGGVRVLADDPGTTTHVKAAVIDDRLVFIGSHNLTQSALRHNNELSIMVDSPDLAAQVKSYLERIR